MVQELCMLFTRSQSVIYNRSKSETLRINHPRSSTWFYPVSIAFNHILVLFFKGISIYLFCYIRTSVFTRILIEGTGYEKVLNYSI